MLVWLGLRLAACGRAVVLPLPTFGREVGWCVATCGDYERRNVFFPLCYFLHLTGIKPPR